MYKTLSFQYAGALDWEYDETGEPVTPGGRALTERIAASLTFETVRSAAVEQHEYYGWGFTSELGRDSFYNVLNAVDPDVFFTVKMEWYLAKKTLFRSPEIALKRYCQILRDAVSSLDGVSEVKWEEQRR